MVISLEAQAAIYAVDVIETDVIPPDYTPGMLRLDAKLVYDDKGFAPIS